MKKLIIGSKYEVPRAHLKYNCDYVISIQDFHDTPVPLPVGIKPENHWHFYFDDLTEEVSHRYSSRDSSVVRGHPPDIKDVRGILAQYRAIPDGAKIYIHCFAGISRSTAMSYMCFCDAAGPGYEDGCMMETERAAIASGIWPNDLIVKLADQELNRNGKMIEAVKAWKVAETAMSAYDGLTKAVEHSNEIKKSIGPEWEAQQKALKIDKSEDSE